MKIEEQLNSFWNDNSYPEYGGFTYFDESKKGILMKNVRMTDFQSFYPTLLIDLHRRGYKVEGIDDKYQRIIDIISNKHGIHDNKSNFLIIFLDSSELSYIIFLFSNNNSIIVLLKINNDIK